jgi:hypothetical protein
MGPIITPSLIGEEREMILITMYVIMLMKVFVDRKGRGKHQVIVFLSGEKEGVMSTPKNNFLEEPIYSSIHSSTHSSIGQRISN